MEAPTVECMVQFSCVGQCRLDTLLVCTDYHVSILGCRRGVPERDWIWVID